MVSAHVLTQLLVSASAKVAWAGKPGKPGESGRRPWKECLGRREMSVLVDSRAARLPPFLHSRCHTALDTVLEPFSSHEVDFT